MRYFFISFCLFFSGFSCAYAQTAKTYTLDSSASQMGWTGHAAVGTYAPTGTIKLNPSTLSYTGKEITGGRFEINMRSLRAENADLETHLRDSDFFDVEKFPKALFELKSTKDGIAKGKLTIKGVTKAVSFPVVMRKAAPGLHIMGKARVDRTKFGIKYNSPNFFKSLGDNAIADTFDLKFTLVVRLAEGA